MNIWQRITYKSAINQVKIKPWLRVVVVMRTKDLLEFLFHDRNFILFVTSNRLNQYLKDNRYCMKFFTIKFSSKQFVLQLFIVVCVYLIPRAIGGVN